MRNWFLPPVCIAFLRLNEGTLIKIGGSRGRDLKPGLPEMHATRPRLSAVIVRLTELT